MEKTTNRKAVMPLFIVFMLVNVFCTASATWLQSKNIDPLVLAIANCILFVLSLVILFRHKKALQNSNPNVFVRSVMSGTFIKLLVIGGAAIIYFIIAGKDKSVYAVLASIGLYFIYTVIEVRTAQLLNREHGSH